MEDAILFPDEVDGEMVNNLFRDGKSAMEKWESSPDID
jgi:hypothetical protein